MKTETSLMDKIISLAKRRGFVFPGSEIYGGLANSWDYGPLGVELKNNIQQLWWERFVHRRDDMVGIDAALIMNPKVWEASGHISTFSDPLVECKKCHHRFRLDEIGNSKSDLPAEVPAQAGARNPKQKIICPDCGGELTKPKQFNLMLKTFLGPAEERANAVYLRPEIAQAMFVNFKQVLDTTRKRLPFGIASQGKAFRNEITPGNFIFRTREFDLMEFEYFVKPPSASSRTNADLVPRHDSGQAQTNAEKEEWEKWFEYWRNEMKEWITNDLGIDPKKIHEVEISKEDRAHYSKRTIDFEYEYPFGQKELYGLAYRADFDLKNHEKFSGQNLKYRDPETGEEFWPHVIEPTFGLNRSVLATLLEAYTEEQTANSKEQRVYLKLPLKLAPYKAAVFPLLANKPELVKFARKIYDDLRKHFTVAWDDRGNIGKRYYSQDEIGTPFCITIDFDSLKKNDVTVRDRNTAKQERVKIEKLGEYIEEKLKS